MIGVGVGLTQLRQNYLFADPYASLMSTLLSGAAQLIAHPLEYGSMFQDRAGTTPVTAPGQLVGMVLDHGFTGSKPMPGPELVTNGTFDTDTDWALGPDTVISGGVLSTTSTIAGIIALQNLTDFVVGTTYEITYTVLSTNGEVIVPRLSNQSNSSAPATTTTGTFTALVKAVSTIGRIQFNVGGNGLTATIDNISVRELPGYHATAISDAARGVYAVVPETGRRNLLTYTEQFDNAVWEKTSVTVTPNAATAPDGTTTAEKITPSAVLGYQHGVDRVLALDGTYTLSCYAKAGEYGYLVFVLNNASGTSISFDLTTGTVGANAGGYTASIEDAGAGWFRCSFTFTPGAGNNRIRIIARNDASVANWTPDGTSGIFIYGAQLELGSTAAAYQKVVSEFDVTEEGVPSLSYISYNGVNTAYSTPALPAPLVDKAQVFAGVRKLSDAAAGIVAELSVSVGGNEGSFYLGAPESPIIRYSSAGRGNINISISTVANITASGAAPDTAVITAIHDIAGDLSRIARNGVFGNDATGDKGSGNFNPLGTYPLYYGARAGTSIFFNGRHYATLGPITRFSAANATTEQIEAAEAYYTARVI